MELKDQLRQISASEKYRAHAGKHRRVIYLLTGIAIVQYSLYFLVIAWAAGLAGMVWPAGSAVSVIIWFTVLVNLLSLAISAVYVWWTGRYHDPEREAILRELGLWDE